MGKWILAFLIAAAVLFLCWKLRGVMLTPVCRGKGQSCLTTAWTRKQEKSPGVYRWDRGM